MVTVWKYVNDWLQLLQICSKEKKNLRGNLNLPNAMSLLSHVNQNNESEEPQTWVELPLGNRNNVVNTTVIKITCTLLLIPHTLSLCGCECRQLWKSALNLRVLLIPCWKAFYIDWRLSSTAKNRPSGESVQHLHGDLWHRHWDKADYSLGVWE